MDKIDQLLDDIEVKYNIKILYACESGSRAWGMASANSDYDIRFIFVSAFYEDYLLGRLPETLEFFSEDKIYDFAGWEVRKTVNLLEKGNGSVQEWLNSPVVYRKVDGFYEEISKLSINRVRVMKSFAGLASSMKKPILNLNFYLHQDLSDNDGKLETPKVSVPQLIDLSFEKGLISKEVCDEIMQLIEQKVKCTDKSVTVPRSKAIDDWIVAVEEHLASRHQEFRELEKHELDRDRKTHDAFILQTLKLHCAWKFS